MSTDRATREDDTPAAAPNDDIDRSAERTSGQQGSPVDGQAVRRAETRTREEYADAARADGGPMSRDNHPDNREAREEEHRGEPERRDHSDRAEPRDRETYADEVRADHSAGDHRPTAEAPAPADADQEAASAQDQQETSHQPETTTFDNKDIEVTHNASDGLWIEGLPGDPPARIGDLIRSPEDPAESRGEKLRKELGKEAEDITDTSGKWADYFQEILDNPQPTHSMTHSRPPETAISGAEHGINAGHGAEAFLTLAIVGAAAVHKLHERLQRAWDH